MTSLRSENRSSFPATALSALVLGLVLCPSVYVAINVPLLFLFREPAFWFVGLLLMLISSGYLLFRFLGKPKEPASGGLLAEILSWFVIAVFTTIFATNIPIPFRATTFDQIATFFIFFLFASLLSLPVVLMRKTALQQRLMKLPNIVITPLVVLVVPVSTAIVVVAELLCPPPLWFAEFVTTVSRIPFFTPFFTTFERFSVLLLIFFLLASMFSLSVLLMRKTVSQQRLMKLPNIINTLLLVLLGLIVLVLAVIVGFYLLCPYPLFWFG
ncbi:MAG: hypothetical protein FWH15_02590 [Betaproteobacteria bacterium]|nr:hypothetical protein [Betaproteobacteria bacterium]